MAIISREQLKSYDGRRVPLEDEMPEIQITHLVRGAPAVRKWSKYQQSVWSWSLCGRKQHAGEDDDIMPRLRLTEDVTACNCKYCHQLLQ